MLKKGTLAPDVALGTETLYRVLERGPAVLFFFPKAFTPTCTEQARAFGGDFDRLAAAGYTVIGVSTDDQATNDRFRESLGLPFPLVGDPTGETVRALRVRWPIIGMTQRVTYVIGRDRRIEEAYHKELDGPTHSGVACQLASRKS